MQKPAFKAISLFNGLTKHQKLHLVIHEGVSMFANVLFRVIFCFVRYSEITAFIGIEEILHSFIKQWVGCRERRQNQLQSLSEIGHLNLDVPPCSISSVIII